MPIRPGPNRRYPLAPLAAAIGVELGVSGGNRGANQYKPADQRHGLAELAQQLGISHGYAQQLHQHGLTDAEADRYACRLDLHPGSVWPDWWDIDIPEFSPYDDTDYEDKDPYGFAS